MRCRHTWALVSALLAACGGAESGGTGPGTGPGAAPVASVAVAPGNDTIIVADSIQLTATPKDSAGSSLSGRVVTWTSSASSVATVTSSGLVRTVGMGSATIMASVGTASGSVAVTVVPHVAVAPELPSLFAGDTLHLRAVLTNARGDTLAAAPIQWTSGSPAVATISGAGVVSGLAPGTATITATVSGQAAAVDVVALSAALRPNREIAYDRVDAVSSPQRDQVRLLNPADSTSVPATASVTAITDFVWSRDGTHLTMVYLANAQTSQPKSGVWVANADGTGEVQISTTGTSPTWSPDGTHVAFVVSVSGDLELYSNTTTNSALLRLTTATGADAQPDWSPDGRRIVWERNFRELWIARSDGSGARLLYASPTFVHLPRWAPDGRHISYYGGQDPNAMGSTASGVWIINPDGTGRRAISDNCGATSCSTTNAPSPPVWSRDGMRLFYADATQLVRATIAGPVLAGFATPCPGTFDMSPDGQMLVVVCSDAAQIPPWQSVFVLSQTGTAVRRLTQAESAGQPRWRP